MAKKGHLFLGITEAQKNRWLWEQYFSGRTISTDLGRTAKNELASAVKNISTGIAYKF